MEQFFKLPVVFKLTKSERLAACFVVSGDATADAIRVVRSVLVAISCHQLPSQRALGHAGLLISKRILLSRTSLAGRGGVVTYFRRVTVRGVGHTRSGHWIHPVWGCHASAAVYEGP